MKMVLKAAETEDVKWLYLARRWDIVLLSYIEGKGHIRGGKSGDYWLLKTNLTAAVIYENPRTRQVTLKWQAKWWKAIALPWKGVS